MASDQTPDLEYLAGLTVPEFDRYSLQIPPDQHPELATAYAQHVAGRLNDEAEAAQHFAKWLSIGGGDRPEHIEVEDFHRRTGSVRLDREKNLQQAQRNLDALMEAIEADKLLTLMVAVSPVDIRAALQDLGEILNDPGIPNHSAAKLHRPTKLPNRSTFAARMAMTRFFPADYPVSDAARVFLLAWPMVEESAGTLSFRSIRSTMQQASSDAVKDRLAVATDWLSGKRL